MIFKIYEEMLIFSWFSVQIAEIRKNIIKIGELWTMIAKHKHKFKNEL